MTIVLRYGAKRRYVYAIHSPAAREIKIGLSADPTSRLKELQWAHGRPLVVLVQALGERADERALHELLAPHRLQGEWFEECDAVMAAVDDLRKREECRIARFNARRRKRKEVAA